MAGALGALQKDGHVPCFHLLFGKRPRYGKYLQWLEPSHVERNKDIHVPGEGARRYEGMALQSAHREGVCIRRSPWTAVGGSAKV